MIFKVYLTEQKFIRLGSLKYYRKEILDSTVFVFKYISYLNQINLFTLSSASLLESNRHIHMGRLTSLCTWALTRSTSILVKQWSRKTRSLLCSTMVISLVGAKLHLNMKKKTHYRTISTLTISNFVSGIIIIKCLFSSS